MNATLEFLSANPGILLGVAVGLGILAVWLKTYSHGVKLWLRMTIDRVPLVGAVARIGGNPALRAKVNQASELCRAEVDFARRYLALVLQDLSPKAHANAVAYLAKAQDLAHEPFSPPLLLTLSMILMPIESWLLAWVMGPHLSESMTMVQREFFAAPFGFGVAAIQFAISHWSGVLLAHYRAFNRNSERLLEVGDRPQQTQIGPDADQSTDDKDSSAHQFFSRSPHRGSAIMAWSLMAFLLTIGMLIASVRIADQHAEALHVERVRQAVVGDQTATSMAEVALTEVGHSVAISFFLCVYIAVQGLGVAHGFRSAKNGARSREVFGQIHGHTMFSAYTAARRKDLAKVNAVYTALQSRIFVPGRTRTPPLEEALAAAAEGSRPPGGGTTFELIHGKA